MNHFVRNIQCIFLSSLDESTTTFATASVCRAALATNFSSSRIRRELIRGLRGLRIGIGGGSSGLLGAFLGRIANEFFLCGAIFGGGRATTLQGGISMGNILNVGFFFIIRRPQ